MIHKVGTGVVRANAIKIAEGQNHQGGKKKCGGSGKLSPNQEIRAKSLTWDPGG